MEKLNELKERLIDACKNTMDYTSRINYHDFWLAVLALFIISIPAGLVLMLLGFIPVLGPVLGLAYDMAVMLVLCALAVRRMNDTKGPKFLPFVMCGCTIAAHVMFVLAGFMKTSLIGISLGGILDTAGFVISAVGVLALIGTVYFAMRPTRS